MSGRGMESVPLRYSSAMNMPAFLAHHPVFTFERFCREEPTVAREAMKKRLQRAQGSGKVKQVARGVFAAVPPGVEPGVFRPDPFLVLAAKDPAAIFCGHSALELNGLAYSVWHEVAAYRTQSRNLLVVDGVRYRFFRPPTVLSSDEHQQLGVATLDRRGVFVRALTPERAVVEGFRSPAAYGGLGELLQSLRGLVRLRWTTLRDVLDAYGEQNSMPARAGFSSRCSKNSASSQRFSKTCGPDSRRLLSPSRGRWDRLERFQDGTSLSRRSCSTWRRAMPRSSESYRSLAEGSGHRVEILEKVVRLGELLAELDVEDDLRDKLALREAPH